MTQTQETSLVYQQADCELRVEFQRSQDRWEHALYLGQQCLLRSIEGDATEDWPPSPPVQEIQRSTTRIDNQSHPCLLATGMAGKSFWSLALRPAAGLVFEHACRLPANTSAQLRSSYKTLTEWQLAADGARTVVHDHQICLQPVAGTALRQHAEYLEVFPDSVVLASHSHTPQWGYRLFLSCG